jgi:hypothetical protein
MVALSRSALPMLLALGACAGSPRPTTMRTLSSLSSDPQERNEELASSQARPGPENRPGQTKKEARVETAAATAAAIIGTLFSHSPSVVVGVGAPVDENLLVGAPPAGAPAGGKRDDDKDEKRPATEPTDAGALVPWVRIAPDRSEGATPAPTETP